jgi:hypothetical protein
MRANDKQGTQLETVEDAIEIEIDLAELALVGGGIGDVVGH